MLVQFLSGGVVPQSCMTDFEIGAINDFDTIYPIVPKFGCRFHLAQSIFRNVHQLGLGNLYQYDLGFRTNIKMISALAFVSVANVIRDFNSLAAQCGLAEQPVLDYFEYTYIGQPQRARRNDPIFSPNLWNINSRVNLGQRMLWKVGTTNSIETCVSPIRVIGKLLTLCRKIPQ